MFYCSMSSCTVRLDRYRFNCETIHDVFPRSIGDYTSPSFHLESETNWWSRTTRVICSNLTFIIFVKRFGIIKYWANCWLLIIKIEWEVLFINLTYNCLKDTILMFSFIYCNFIQLFLITNCPKIVYKLFFVISQRIWLIGISDNFDKCW